MNLSPKERAERSAHEMWSDDRASEWFGMELGTVDEGRAVVTLCVDERHVNGHDICHGGVIFALADSAFAFACNSRNTRTVAFHNEITFLAPARLGDVLTATAEEIDLSGRTGITDITVTKGDGSTIAQVRGVSRSIGGTLFDEQKV
ncbi:MAG: hydroxyphenylacetyl-CoA thioesterase PaaI [Pseudomonadota bacterium]